MIDYHDRAFWLNLRRELGFNEYETGIGQCDWWADDARLFLSRANVPEFFIGVGEISQEHSNKLKLTYESHFFLYRHDGDNVFVADGTAGQFDIDYPQGYYGPITQAPRILHLFYRRGVRSNSLRETSKVLLIP